MSEEMTTQEAWRKGSQGAQAAYARRRITVDPITRLEGHGKIDIFLDEAGDVERAYFQVPELRGFEKFAEGRPAEDMPQITSRICGVCPTAHHMASTKALDALYKVDPPPAAKKIRELVYSAFMAEDHALHFYFLGGPDFVVGPDAPAAQRNILGVIGVVGEEVGKRVITMRRRIREIITTVGGQVIHPVLGLPGGVAKRVTAEQQAVIKETAADAVDFARFTLDTFRNGGAGQPGVRGPHRLRRLHPSHLLHGPDGREEPAQLLRRQDPRGHPGRRGVGQVPRGRLPGAGGRARRALVVRQVLLPEEGRLERLHRRRRQRHLLGGPAGPAQRRRRHGHPAGPGGLRGDVRHPRGQAGAPHAGQPLGPGGRAALRRRAPARNWPTTPS